MNRIKGLLAGGGMRLGVHGEVETQFEEVRQWDGAPRPAAWRARLKRAWQKVPHLSEQIGSLEAERRTALRIREEQVIAQVRQFATLRGIGVNSAGLFVMAFFAWRDVQTPKAVGA